MALRKSEKNKMKELYSKYLKKRVFLFELLILSKL